MEYPTDVTDFSEAPRTGLKEVLNSEYLYYSSVLKTIAPTLTAERDRQSVILWVRKLFSPEYHVSPQLQKKRNRYLLYLTITLLNDETIGILRFPPPRHALPDFNDLEHEPSPPADWEKDNMWHETLQTLPDDFQKLDCSGHDNLAECAADHALDKILDEEFRFMLYLARPYAAMLRTVDERTKVATWLQVLCIITDDACSTMRAVRNDYMMALLGYIHDLRVEGPFKNYPPWKTLPPIAELAKIAAQNKPITHPGSPEANDFMASQIIPDEGAFCYIAITGRMLSSTVTPTA